MKQIVDKLNKIAKKINENVELSDRDLIIDSLDSITKAYGGTPNDSNLIVDKLEDIYNNIGSAPSGNIEITENGENINVAQYATASVAVPNPSTGKINITTLDEVNVTDYAAAQVVDRNLSAENIKKDVEILGITGTLESGGATWTTVAAEQSGTTVFNSGVNLYFLQLSNVTDFGSPVIKVTLDGNTYYCYWDNQAGAWHDAYYTVVVAATVYGGTAYWGIANVSDTAATTHTGKIERIADYSLAYCTTTQKGYFINNDTGKTIMTSETIGTTSYGCEKITYGGYTLLKVNGGYATFTQGNV